MKWLNEAPTTDNLKHTKNPEEYYWVKGGNFNREIMVRANKGVSSILREDGSRYYFAELNFTFMCEGLPDIIWQHDLPNYYLDKLQWCGPIPRGYEE